MLFVLRMTPPGLEPGFPKELGLEPSAYTNFAMEPIDNIRKILSNSLNFNFLEFINSLKN